MDSTEYPPHPVWIGISPDLAPDSSKIASVEEAFNYERLRRLLASASVAVVCDPLRMPTEMIQKVDPSLPLAIVDPVYRHCDPQRSEWLPDPVLESLTPWDLILTPRTIDLSGQRILDLRCISVVNVSKLTELPFAVEDWLGRHPGRTEYSRRRRVAFYPPTLSSPTMRHQKMVYQRRAGHIDHLNMQLTAEYPKTKSVRVLEVGASKSGFSHLLTPAVGSHVAFYDKCISHPGEHPNSDKFVAMDLPSSLRLPVTWESYDVAWLLGLLGRNSARITYRLIEESWRAVRPGGNIVWMDEFVADTNEGAAHMPLSISDFTELVNDACGGALVLQSIATIEYPFEPNTKCALVAFRRLGYSTRW